ncbi:MAG: cytochrome c peroxidase [Fimbriimonas sp.]|nr:cytochrome c peroxidase [Fimbriimonas sp.]
MDRVNRGLHAFAWVFCCLGVGCALVSCGGGGGSSPSGGSSTIANKEQLGKALFFDTSLSNPVGQSCGTCHSPAKNFSDPRPGPTSAGAVNGLFGFRHAPSISYMAYSPPFSVTGGEAGGAVGGQFWDGRASTLNDQVHFPLLNPIEMNNPTEAAMVAKVAVSPESAPMKRIYGAGVFNDSTTAFNAIVDAIVAFEKSPAVSPFSSKYDAFLAGRAQLSATEIQGLGLFNGKGGCSGCHTSSPSPDGTPPLFTNFCYANLGLPKNPANPYYTIPAQYNPAGSSFVDLGLQITTGQSGDAGNFMTPTLRNVALRSPYFHNGIFSTLTQVLNFYNTRDLGGFAAPEVPQTEDTTELGNLKLTTSEVNAIVAFLQTLNDGYSRTP